MVFLFVGNEVKLGALKDCVKTRLMGEVEFLNTAYHIEDMENDILMRLKELSADYVLYDVREFFDDGREFINTVKAIYKTNHIKPILVVDTTNPKSEIVKCAAAQQIKYLINASKSLGDQKDSLEKIILGYEDANKSKDILEAEEVVQSEQKTLSDFVEDLYSENLRRKEEEQTVIINKKTSGEVAINAFKDVIRIVFSVISVILMAIAIITLLYPETREAFFGVINNIFSSIKSMF